MKTKNTFYPSIPEEKLEELKQFIRGAMLGDGSIPRIQSAGKNYKLTFGHSPKQLCYLNWKHSYLNTFDLAGKITTCVAKSERYKNGECTSYHFKTITHPLFTEYRKLYYPDNKKILNLDDISNLNEFGLAVWYMDDGYVIHRKTRATFAVICSTGFTREETEFLIKLLKDKWNLDATYYSTEKGIRFSTKSTVELMRIIDPHLVKCLAYKGVLYKPGELLEAHLN